MVDWWPTIIVSVISGNVKVYVCPLFTMYKTRKIIENVTNKLIYQSVCIMFSPKTCDLYLIGFITKCSASMLHAVLLLKITDIPVMYAYMIVRHLILNSIFQ